jgi:two-component system chemotaxis sensor kinase CheA
MAIDMRQFHQTFFEESLEGLTNMETELLHLEKAAADNGRETVVADPEILNTIFRAAHSIKGGSSTFGFEDVVAFAHVLESRLDAMRDGHLRPSRKVISLLLLSVDCLRSLIISARTGKAGEKNAIDSVRLQLENLDSEQPSLPATSVPASRSQPAKIAHWQITFRPHLHLFHTGNDPLRILRELNDLGECQVQAEISSLPSWDKMNPEECYLAWKIELIGPIPRESVNEVFSWVVDDCSLEISLKPMQSLAPRSIAEAVASMDATAGTLRVSVPKIDALINTVGELVITQTMLSLIASNFSFDNLSRLFAGITQLERNTRELQESVMSIRMLPLSFAFNRLPRLVHDMSQRLGKKVELVFDGEQTEIDKTVIDRLIDPLMHLARNSLDHGIEHPAERKAAGKPETGRIELKAYQKGGNVVIEVRDDGRGLSHERIFAKALERGLVSPSSKLSPEEIAELIFLPGFSTAESVSDLSGRGVGMDVVRNNVRSLGGSVEVSSQSGRGTFFMVRLPLTLAILDGLSVQVGEHTYILPLVSIVESVRIHPEQVSCPAGSSELYGLRKEYMPLLRLSELFHVASRSTELSQGLLVIVEAEGKKAGLHVDDLLGQQQVVIKNLATHYRKVEGISAATILGDGTVAMILDVPGLIRLAHASTGQAASMGDSPASKTASPTLN